jgi:hypothetical protein
MNIPHHGLGQVQNGGNVPVPYAPPQYNAPNFLPVRYRQDRSKWIVPRRGQPAPQGQPMPNIMAQAGQAIPGLLGSLGGMFGGGLGLKLGLAGLGVGLGAAGISKLYRYWQSRKAKQKKLMQKKVIE